MDAQVKSVKQTGLVSLVIGEISLCDGHIMHSQLFGPSRSDTSKRQGRSSNRVCIMPIVLQADCILVS